MSDEITYLAGVGKLEEAFQVRWTPKGVEIGTAEIRLFHRPVGEPQFYDLIVWEPGTWFPDRPTWLKDHFERGSEIGVMGSVKQRTYTTRSGEEKVKPQLALYWISQQGWRRPKRVA